jgi:hypothetical protein
VNPIDLALDTAYPKVADELHDLARKGSGMSGRGMCSRFLEVLVLNGWTLLPPAPRCPHGYPTTGRFDCDDPSCSSPIHETPVGRRPE